jgi:urease accessory protein
MHSPIIHQRATGAAFAGLVQEDPAHVRIADLRQQGSAKVILPHVGTVPEVVFLNTSGGLTAGDRLTYGLTLGDGVRAVATTQTAERAYLATNGTAEVTVHHTVGVAGWLDWLPQETILFQEAALSRRTRVDLGPRAGCLLLEAVVLGRASRARMTICGRGATPPNTRSTRRSRME